MRIATPWIRSCATNRAPTGAATCQPRVPPWGLYSAIENSNALKGQNRFVVKNLVSPFQAWAVFSYRIRIPRGRPRKRGSPGLGFLLRPLRGGRTQHQITKAGIPSFPPLPRGYRGFFRARQRGTRASPRPPLPPFAGEIYLVPPSQGGNLSLGLASVGDRRRGLTHCLVAVLSLRIPCVLPPCRRAYTPAIGNSGRLLEEFGVFFRDDGAVTTAEAHPGRSGPASLRLLAATGQAAGDGFCREPQSSRRDQARSWPSCCRTSPRKRSTRSPIPGSSSSRLPATFKVPILFSAIQVAT